MNKFIKFHCLMTDKLLLINKSEIVYVLERNNYTKPYSLIMTNYEKFEVKETIDQILELINE